MHSSGESNNMQTVASWTKYPNPRDKILVHSATTGGHMNAVGLLTFTDLFVNDISPQGK